MACGECFTGMLYAALRECPTGMPYALRRCPTRYGDATILRERGLHEVGADDGFLQIVWGKFVGSASAKDLSFLLRSKKRKTSSGKRVLERGYRNMERILKKSCTRHYSTEQLRKVAGMQLPDGLGKSSKLLVAPKRKLDLTYV